MLTDDQWAQIAPVVRLSPYRELRGKPRRDDREVLEGILWILKTGAQWNELPKKYPSYQTCHRRYQEWVRKGVFEEIITGLAQDMKERGKLDLKECFIDGTFGSAKKGATQWVRQNAEKARRSWLFRTKALFQSPSMWPLLLRTKSPWWKRQLPHGLRKKIQHCLSETKRMTATSSTSF